MPSQDRYVYLRFGNMIAIHTTPSYQRRKPKTVQPSVSSNSWLCPRGSYNEGFIPQLLSHSKFPVGPSILQTELCSLPCDESTSMDKIHNPRVNSDTP